MINYIKCKHEMYVQYYRIKFDKLVSYVNN